MKLIVGLGNPGRDYEATRHNAGFMVLDALAGKLGVELVNDRKLKADIAITLRAETLILAKPTTFMNKSGDSVQKIASYYKVAVEDVWVVSDDLDLEFGTIRVRRGGSSGGQNGLKDIIEKVGEDFVRFRVGIKNSQADQIAADKFVLQKFTGDEQEKLEGIIDKSLDLIVNALQNGPEHVSIK